VGGVRCRIHPDVLEAFSRYDWPGNVRELANMLERAQILAENHLITLKDLPETLSEIQPCACRADGERRYLREVERHHVQEVLRQEKGNKVHAARALGISRRALYRLIAKYHLDQTAV
jgi:transcriptional regulator with PAS, ATPase and Fis domain